MEFISGMKDGFDSVIEQGGINVSGGQKQRLSIARALVRRPKIYIFDDSFSALDFKTDARLRAALKKETLDCYGLNHCPAGYYGYGSRSHYCFRGWADSGHGPP